MTPQESVARALEAARGHACVAIAEEGAHAHLRWAGNALTTNGLAQTRRLTVVVAVRGACGTAAGVASAGGEPADPAELVRRAAAEAACAPPAEDAGPLVEGDGDAPGWDAPPPEPSAAALAGLTPALGEAFAAARGEGRLLYGYARHGVTSTWLGTSAGLRRRHDQPAGHVQLTARGCGASAWAGVPAPDPARVDVAALYAEVCTRLGWARRRVALPPGRYETILPPAATADLAVQLYAAAGARDAHDGRSVFSRAGGGSRVGERISPLPLTLRSDPAAPGLECAPFVVAHASDAAASVFDNGLPLSPTRWMDRGTLCALVQTRRSAALAGLPLTPRVDNLVLEGEPGGPTLDEMVAQSRRALLLTCLWYVNEVDPRTLLLTGVTRDGVYLVEGGEVVGAADDFRFAESPVELLGRAAQAGRTVPALGREWGETFPRMAMPPLRVPGFNFTSVSPAR